MRLKPCKVTTVGTFTFTPNKQNLVITSDLAVKFMIQPAIASSILAPFLVAEETASFTNYKRNKTIHRTLSVLTKDSLESNRLIGSIYSMDSMFIPQSLDYNMLLSGSKFYWDEQDATFKSVEKVSLAFFGQDVVKRQYDAYIEIGYAYESDFVNIYLQSKSGAWMYFKIKRGQMGIASSVADVYNTITLLKDSDRVYREGKEVLFEFMPADMAMRDNFVARMEDFMERFKLNTAPAPK